MFTVEVQGADKIKNIFRDIGLDLSAGQFKQILDEAGRIVVQEAKQETDLPGELADLFKKDLSVYRDRRSARNSEYVIIGPRFRPYTIRGQSRKVALIAQHFTTGFSQTDRRTRGGQRRGRVARRYHNPVLDAYRNKRMVLNAGIEKGIVKKINKIKTKYGI